MLVLHFIPIRVLLLAWGIIKFTKRIIRPHVVTNNEVLDFLSRIPDDEELVINFSLVVLSNWHTTLMRSLLLIIQFRFNFESFHYNSRLRQPDVMRAIGRSNHRIVLTLIISSFSSSKCKIYYFFYPSMFVEKQSKVSFFECDFATNWIEMYTYLKWICK